MKSLILQVRVGKREFYSLDFTKMLIQVFSQNSSVRSKTDWKKLFKQGAFDIWLSDGNNRIEVKT